MYAQKAYSESCILHCKLLFMDQCAGHSQDTSYPKDAEVVSPHPRFAPGFSKHLTSNNQVIQTLKLQAACKKNVFYD
jgi:hypothetical protein